MWRRGKTGSFDEAESYDFSCGSMSKSITATSFPASCLSSAGRNFFSCGAGRIILASKRAQAVSEHRG